jgi:hypothetical protein
MLVDMVIMCSCMQLFGSFRIEIARQTACKERQAKPTDRSQSKGFRMRRAVGSASGNQSAPLRELFALIRPRRDTRKTLKRRRSNKAIGNEP